jgi:ABC-type Mn2+/Zn2+ transport system permease subunit
LERLGLFRFAIGAALAAGLVCPLVGALLWCRRMSFYGITLPQFAASGVVFGYVLLPWWIGSIGLGGLSLDEALSDPHAVTNYLFVWAGLFGLAGLLVLARLSRSGRGSEIGRLAAAFAVANSATYLIGRMSPVGRSHVEELLQGEALGVGLHEFETVAVALALVLGVVLLQQRRFVAVSYDREFASVVGLPIGRIDLLFHAACALTVGAGTLILGPTMLFGLLVIPPIGSRALARSLRGFLLWSAGLGCLSVLLGIGLSFQLDLPLGASVTAGACLASLPALLRRQARERCEWR